MGHMHLVNRSFLLAKRETTYGTDSSPAAADLIEVYDLQMKPSLESVVRTTNKANISPEKPLIGKRSSGVSFKVPLWAQPSGAIFAAPRWTRLLKACGVLGTVGTNVIACAPSSLTPPQTNGPDSLTMLVLDSPQSTNLGTVTKLLGCVGTAKFVLVNGTLPYIEFEFSGSYVTPVAYNSSTHVYSGSEETLTEVPWLATLLTVRKNVDSTPVNLSSSLAAIQSIELDLGMTVAMRESCITASGVLGFFHSSRAPKMTINPERDTPGTIDWWTLMTAGTVIDVKATFGSGNRGYVYGKYGVITAITPGDRNGVAVDQVEVSLFGDDNEFEVYTTYAAS